MVLIVTLSASIGYSFAGTVQVIDNSPIGSVSNFSDPESVIRTMVDAMDKQDVPRYISTFTQDNRTEMEKVYNENSPDTPFFKEKNVRLVNIKKLPTDVGNAAASLSEREGLDLMVTDVYYVELQFKVDKQQKWLYNGVNHRVIVITKENGDWKIVRVSVPSIEYIIEKGHGFGTKDEQKAKQIENTMDKKGLVF